MRQFYSAAIAAAQLPGFAGVKTYAAHPVWKGAVAGEVKFAPLDEDEPTSKKKARRIWNDLRDLEKRTAKTRVDAFGKIHTQGCIGRMGLLVAHALLFDFLNHRTGRLDPAIATIAEKMSISISSVRRALDRLKAAKALNWIQRCYSTVSDGGSYQRMQESNAYGFLPQNGWRGFTPAPAPAPPDPDTWGATPPTAQGAELVDALAAGDKRRAVHMLESDPQYGWQAAAARLGRRLF